MSASEGNHAESLPEPKTPMWLPAVGAVLFLVVGLLWGLSDPPADPSKDQRAPAASAAPSAAPAAPARPAAPGH